MRVGVFLPNWIGDVVMATPALRSLRALAGDDGVVVGVMRPYVAEVLAGGDAIDQVIPSGKNRRDPQLGSRAVIEQLRAARLDTVALLTNSLRTAWLAWRAGVPQRVGVARDWRGPLLTTRLFEPRRGRRLAPLPTIDSYLQVAYATGGPWEPPRLELETTAADEQAADAAWSTLGLPAGEQVIVLNNGGAFGAAKSWSAGHFATLAQRLVADRGVHVLVNCGPAERDVAREIVQLAADPRVVSLAELDVPLGLSKAVIRRARMLVTTDSGPRFFGIAFGKPVVSLFGPTDAALTNTHTPLETTVSLGLDCQPCWARTCPLGHHRCMQDLSVARVAAAVDAALDAPEVASPFAAKVA